MIIYPRKALARDQFERILRLLYYLNKELKRRKLEKYAISLGIWDGDSFDSWGKIVELRKEKRRDIEFRGIKCPVCDVRLIYEEKEKVIKCPSCNTTYNYIGDIREWISDKQPDILITNFWALNHRLISRSYKHLLSSSIRCIVIDEAHVLKDLTGAFISYLLCRFLLRLAMQYKGVSTDSSALLKLSPESEYDALEWIRDYLRDKNFTLVLSSATISTASTVIERIKDARIFTCNFVYPKLYEVFKSICKGRGFNPIVYHDYNEIYQKLYDDKSIFKKLRRKIDVVIIIAPHPMRGIETIAQSTALCSLFWSKEFNQKFLLFADNKEAIERLYHFINDIIIGERGEIYDHVFLTNKNQGSRIRNFIRRLWENYNSNLINGENILIRALSDPLYWLVFPYTSYFNSILIGYKDLDKAVSQVYKYQNIHFNNLLDIAKNSCDDIFYNRAVYLDVHHADLDRQKRQEIENRLKRASLLGVLCTSTLELGIDIDHISTIIQYRPIAAENFIQRLGRAGRKPMTMYIALGFLLLSNFDTLYLNERYSNEVLFNVRPKLLPLKNRRVRANAIFYTIVDFLAYLDHLTYYSSRLRDVKRTEERIQEIYQALITYEKPLISIITSLLDLPLDEVKSEYEIFRNYLQVLYNNLRNIDTAPISIKNILYETMERLQVLRNELFSKIITPIGESTHYFEDSETYQRTMKQMFQAVTAIDNLHNELYKLDLYCEAYPEYLIKNKKYMCDVIDNYLQKFQDFIDFLNNLRQIISSAVLYSNINRTLHNLKDLKEDLRDIINYLQKNIKILFTLNLKRILR